MVFIVALWVYIEMAGFTRGYLSANPDWESPSDWKMLMNWPELLGREVSKNMRR